MRGIKTFCALWVILACVPAAKASGQDVEKALRANYEKKEFTLRGFPSGQRLEYDAGGKLIKGGAPGPWKR
jgi:hypothetical protein